MLLYYEHVRVCGRGTGPEFGEPCERRGVSDQLADRECFYVCTTIYDIYTYCTRSAFYGPVEEQSVDGDHARMRPTYRVAGAGLR